VNPKGCALAYALLRGFAPTTTEQIMSNRSRNKLSLRSETLRSLADSQIARVVGGIVDPTMIRNPPRYSETPSCGIVCPPPPVRGEP
jgi:hypothetical protein